jgi:hypothetical protein
MTVKQLIGKLATLPQEYEVVILAPHDIVLSPYVGDVYACEDVSEVHINCD